MKKFKNDYKATTTPQIIHVSPARYLSITGQGDPSEPSYLAHLQALYSTIYTIKFRCKARDEDFVVSKLEGLWWFDEEKYKHVSMTDAPTAIPRSSWLYRMMIRIPDFVTQANLDEAIASVLAKKGFTLAGEVTFFELNEGKVVQTLHIGPFHTEPESLALMAQFCKTHNLLRNGLHHEIYLSDFNRIAPEKLKTILREPVL